MEVTLKYNKISWYRLDAHNCARRAGRGIHAFIYDPYVKPKAKWVEFQQYDLISLLIYTGKASIQSDLKDVNALTGAMSHCIVGVTRIVSAITLSGVSPGYMVATWRH